MKVALYLEDVFNDENIILTQTFKPDKIVYLTTPRGFHAGYYDDFSEFIKSEYPNIILENFTVDPIDNQVIASVLKKNSNLTYAHLSSSSQLLLLAVSPHLMNKGIKLYFTDIDNNRIAMLSKGNIEVAIEDITGLNVASYIDMIGGDILKRTTFINEDSMVMLLTDFIAENQKRWRRLKYLLTRRDVFKYDEKKSNCVIATFKNFNRNDYLQFKWLLTFMKHIGYLKVNKIASGVLNLKFRTPEHKQFLFITGSWLEALTYHTIKMVSDVDDVQTGVSFTWEEGNQIVKNEMDVLASQRAKLYCFSCKDTAHYDVGTLNELSVYANHIGGEHTDKILISTSLPQSRSVTERAKEMNIKLLIYDGNPMTFRRQVEKIFEAENA